MYYYTDDTGITIIEVLHEIWFEELQYEVLLCQELVPKIFIEVTSQDNLK